MDEEARKNIDSVTNEVADHLEFSIEHGGFDPKGETGGCSCSICSYLRGYILVHYYERFKKMYAPSKETKSI